MVGFLEIELFFVVAVVGLIVLALVALGANRREGDVRGSRSLALYLSVISFVALFTLLFTGSFAITSFASIPLDDRSSSNCFTDDFGETSCFGPNGVSASGGVSASDGHVRDGTRQALIAVAAGAILLFHLRRMRELAAESGVLDSPARATLSAFSYAVCFVAMATLLVAGSIVAFSALKILGPGVFGTSSDSGLERNNGVVELVASGVPALASYLLFRWQWTAAQALRAPAPETA
jgi:hypothetical protein